MRQPPLLPIIPSSLHLGAKLRGSALCISLLSTRVRAADLAPDISVRARSPGPHEAHALQDRQTSEDDPVEEAEGDARLGALAEVAAVAVGYADQHGQRDGPGEPEQGRQGEKAERDNGDEERG